jgi:hypothetical protein
MMLPLLAAALLALVPARAGAGAPAAAPAPPRELVIVVVDSLERGPSRISDYDRIDWVFTRAFERRKWPVTVRVERFAGNLAPHDLELRLFNKGIYPEDRGDLTFHAWITLTDQGRKWDLGIIRYQYYPRPLEQMDDALERAARGAAELTADKVGALLFPPAPRR